ncbi:MAG: hypothetical protein HY828_18540 [Actinobacteria bacterium]|nr:hypothetical protein [Actinomycetota bacterium]
MRTAGSTALAGDTTAPVPSGADDEKSGRAAMSAPAKAATQPMRMAMDALRMISLLLRARGR